jgi:hypothetical protein
MKPYNVHQNIKYHTCGWLVLFLNISLYTTNGGPTQRYNNIFNCIQIKKWPLGKTHLWLKEYAGKQICLAFQILEITNYKPLQFFTIFFAKLYLNPSVPPKSGNLTMLISFQIDLKILSKCINFEKLFFARHLSFCPKYFCPYTDTSVRF